MYAVRAPRAFDGTEFLAGGATVLIEGDTIVGVEPFGYPTPTHCPVSTFEGGTLLPGLIDTHVHLVTDSGPAALDRVAGYTDEELDEVVTEALRRQLASGVTTVRDLGDRRYAVVDRRDRQRGSDVLEPRIVAAGPPITTPGGHCHFLGGEVEGAAQIRAAVRERVERGVDVVKVMASGGMTTVGTDVTAPQFSLEDLRLLVETAHAAGLPVAAHAHAALAIDQAVALGVDSIEHASYLRPLSAGASTPAGPRVPGPPSPGDASDEQLRRLGASGIAVCPTLGGFSLRMLLNAPPQMIANMRRFGVTPESLVETRTSMLRRMRSAGVRFVSGADAGIAPPKAHGWYAEAVIELADILDMQMALTSATSVAADVCGLAATTGRLAADLAADLLVVDGDPSVDSDALRRPVHVVLRGRPLTGDLQDATPRQGP
jgi:imidazolonepropionase-like amidohydrolase